MCKSSINSTSDENSKSTGSSSGQRNIPKKQPTDEIEPSKEARSNSFNRPEKLANTMTSFNSVRRRCKRDKQQDWSKIMSSMLTTSPSPSSKRIVKRKKMSNMTAKHQNDTKSGGIDALLPSLIGVIVLVLAIMAKMGFRGRATVAGIDLGTTNSVICVQAQEKGGECASQCLFFKCTYRFVTSMAMLSEIVGEIVCIPDPATNSPVVPSVVSFLDNHHLKDFRVPKEDKDLVPSLTPHPIDVVVGEAAKARINAHPHHTVYHAKRIIGREYKHASVNSLKGEVEFDVVSKENEDDNGNIAAFKIPYHLPPASGSTTQSNSAILTPSQIGSYIINHLRTMTRNYLGHNNIQSAVIAIPAKFEPPQRDATIRAFELAGLKVARILEEPTAAALAYGLHKRSDVHYVMVYDFGGGTLDISLLYIGDGGFIEVLGSEGDEQLGGADFDAAVARWLLNERGGNPTVEVVTQSIRAIEKKIKASDSESDLDVEDLIEELCPKLKQTPLCTSSSLHTLGEKIKISLSKNGIGREDSVATVTCYGLSSIMDTTEELCNNVTPVEFSLTLKEYNLAVEHLYKRSLLPIQRILKNLNLKKEEIDEVVMVGGTTRMPQIRELVRLELGKEYLNTHIDPDLTVAYGAASVID